MELLLPFVALSELSKQPCSRNRLHKPRHIDNFFMIVHQVMKQMAPTPAHCLRQPLFSLAGSTGYTFNKFGTGLTSGDGNTALKI